MKNFSFAKPKSISDTGKKEPIKTFDSLGSRGETAAPGGGGGGVFRNSGLLCACQSRYKSLQRFARSNVYAHFAGYRRASIRALRIISKRATNLSIAAARFRAMAIAYSSAKFDRRFAFSRSLVQVVTRRYCTRTRLDKYFSDVRRRKTRDFRWPRARLEEKRRGHSFSRNYRLLSF